MLGTQAGGTAHASVRDGPGVAILTRTFHFRGIQLSLRGRGHCLQWHRPRHYVQSRRPRVDSPGVAAEQHGGGNRFRELFNKAADAFLDQCYALRDAKSGRRPLENMSGPEHKLLERFRDRILDLAGVKNSGDSRTNLMAEVTMGAGDCRQVAFSKQALFERLEG